MRILIDMQGAQSSGSRSRGIGRYTLALTQAIVKAQANHEILLVLNGAFAETIKPIMNIFDDLLPFDSFHVWNPLQPCAASDSNNRWRMNVSEFTREAFLLHLKPDIILVSSLFEGHGDSAVTSIGRLSKHIPTCVILYDLIPYIHRDLYLSNASLSDWYGTKVEYLRDADLCLAISESSRQEAIKHLGYPSDRAVTISTDADDQFYPKSVESGERIALTRRLGIKYPFIMYTGGIDHRKNIEGLIQAYSQLPSSLRSNYQLVIVCAVSHSIKRHLVAFACNLGLAPYEYIFTGFVNDSDLVSLYRLCHLFVFPSWHEGFGLPALEAMRCGAATIGSNVSSLPEVIGLDEALFDPHNIDSISTLIKRALTDKDFHARLQVHALEYSKNFSWQRSACVAITAMEGLVLSHQIRNKSIASINTSKPKLAYISPLPPEQTGIAEYSALLIPELANFYDITCITDSSSNQSDGPKHVIRCPEWFLENASQFDRVIYHFGNSLFHRYMFKLLRLVPGVVVLHDIYLSGILRQMEFTGYDSCAWSEEIYRSHGKGALNEKLASCDPSQIIARYPCSNGVVDDSIGLIVHSKYAFDLVHRGSQVNTYTSRIIPMVSAPRECTDKALARSYLGIPESAFVVCSFGILGPTKLNRTLLRAWLASSLSTDQDCYLFFVGDSDSTAYGQQISKEVRRHGSYSNIHITGWIDKVDYHRYMDAADLAVQLRTDSRGESSSAILDCMNSNLLTIVNMHGSMAELNPNSAIVLSDPFQEHELIDALLEYRRNPSRFDQKILSAKNDMRQSHDPIKVAQLYREAIETFYSRYLNSPIQQIISSVVAIPDVVPTDSELAALSSMLCTTFPVGRIGNYSA